MDWVKARSNKICETSAFFVIQQDLPSVELLRIETEEGEEFRRISPYPRPLRERVICVAPRSESGEGSERVWTHPAPLRSATLSREGKGTSVE